MDTVSYCVAIEEISRVCASSRRHPLGEQLAGLRPAAAATAPRSRSASSWRRSPRGKKLGCFALTEPEAGSDAGALRHRRRGATATTTCSTAARSSSPTAPTPTSALVFATRRSRRRSIAASPASSCPRDTPGFSRGHHEYKLGVHASGTTELAFEDMRVPARQRLGDEGEGFKIAMSTLDGGRIGIAAQAVGHRAGRLRGGARVRPGAQAVRPADLRLPGDPVLPRRHGDGARRRAPADLQGGLGEGRRRSATRSRRRRPSSSPPRWRSG